MNERIIAIGDIHGCSVALRTLLEEIRPTEDDTIISLGDIVDRGPNSRECVDLLLEVGQTSALQVILGNHEEMMLAVVKEETGPQEWLKHGGVQTLDSYGFTGHLNCVPENHIQLMESSVPYLEMDEFFLTHGNYDPKLPLSEQDPLVLRWTNLVQSTPGPHMSGKRAIVGHTPDESGEVFDMGYLKCIDTFCYGGMWLTALDIVSGKIWQTNEEGVVR